MMMISVFGKGQLENKLHLDNSYNYFFAYWIENYIWIIIYRILQYLFFENSVCFTCNMLYLIDKNENGYMIVTCY